MKTMNDLSNEYEAGCGSEKPVRTTEDLRDLFHASESRYDDAASIDAFWILVFGVNPGSEDVWGDGGLDWPSDAQWAAYESTPSAPTDAA